MIFDSRVPVYPWKRYWVPRDSGYVPDGGFLADPNSECAWAYPGRAVSLAELRERSVLVLLGEAGMGKSRALIQEHEALLSSPPESTCLLYRNLNTFGAGEQRRLAEELFHGPEYGAYCDGARLVVFLDSLDEAIGDIPVLGNWLADQLRQHVIDPKRFQLRIASRTAGWQGRLEEGVSHIWATENGKADVAVYEICPLRRIDIAEAASIRGIAGDVLLAEIRNKEIEALASRPVTLEFLFSQWGKENALSNSKAELYETGILALCEENNPERRARLCLIDPKQRMAVAGRMASALILCGHPALWVGRVQEKPPGDIALSDLTGNETHGDSEFRIDESSLRETLGISGLFTGFGRDRMGFAHQSFAEFLAAWYLQRMGTELDQVMRPLRHHEGGKLVPKLEETAAWLASINRSVLERLIREQPSSLLHVDGAALTDPDKAGLVQVLLERIASKKLFAHDLPGRALRKLSHPGLAEQLRPWILDRMRDRHGRDFAMDLARWCEVHALAGDLANVALDAEEDHLVRVTAAHGVTWIKDHTALVAMKPLALGKAGPDPGRQLKRLVAQALWPQHLTAEEFFADPVDTDENASIGGLDVDISSGEFFKTLTPAHMPAALAWASRNARYSGYSAKRLGTGLMRTAWSFLEEPGVLDAFVTTTLAFLDQHAHLFDDYGKRADDPLADTRKRRLLLTRLLNRIAPETANSLAFSGDRIARQDDLPWLLDFLDTGLSEAEYKCAVKLISDLLRYDSPLASVNRVLDRCGIDAAKPDLVLRKALAWLTHPVRLKSRQVRQARDSWHQMRKLDEKWQPVLLDPPPHIRVRMALERCEQGEWSAWPGLAMELTLEPDSRNFNWPQDVVKQPGWLEATPEIQARIQSAAVSYLIDVEPDSAKLFSSNEFTFSEMAGLTAFELLSQTALLRLNGLTAKHWAKWAPLIICGHHENSDWLKILRVEAYRHAPQAVLDAALSTLDKADRQGHGLSSLHEYDYLWGQPFIDGLLSRLNNLEFKTRSRRTILESLLRRRYPVAHQRAREFLAQKADPDMRRYAAALLLTWDGVESWPLLASLLEREPEFAESFISEAVYDMRWQTEEKPAYELNEEQLAELYLWIEAHFPAERDPVHHGAYRPVARDHIKEYRESLINTLKSAGTWAAVRALERIAAALPDRDWLKWVCHRAREQTMNTQWQAPTWSELLLLLADPRTRIIRTEEDLHRVVIESLRRLQDCLRGSPPMAPFLWDEISGKPKSEGRLSDFVKFHLSNDLNQRGVLINREVEIRNWPGKGRGESLDLLVQGTTHMNTPVSVIIEVKGCWNVGVDTAMETQLKGQYLDDSTHSHGIYLVGWYGPSGGGSACKVALNSLRGELNDQAARLSAGNIDIRAIVVDLSLHKTG